MSLLAHLTTSTLIMDRWVKKLGNCLELKNPRQDVMAVLLVDKNLDRIFIDLGHDRIRWLQFFSKSRNLFERLRYFDRKTSRTRYDLFLYPDLSRDPIVKSVQISTPSDAHLYILLRQYQPALKRIRFDCEDVYLRLCNLSEELDDIVIRMFGSECESAELYSDLNAYLDSFLTDIGIK